MMRVSVMDPSCNTCQVSEFKCTPVQHVHRTKEYTAVPMLLLLFRYVHVKPANSKHKRTFVSKAASCLRRSSLPPPPPAPLALALASAP